MIFEKLVHRNNNLRVRKYFNEIASQWDSMCKEFYSDSVREKILSLIYPEPGNIIADKNDQGVEFVGLHDSINEYGQV